MLQFKLFTLLAIAVAVSAECIVNLEHGRIRGHQLLSRNGTKIFAFQGIPYGKPPVGALRFKHIQPVEPWNDILDTTKDPPMCLQRGLFSSNEELIGEEDCLYLNVYTPLLPNESNPAPGKLDVMFWIHGGAWVSGSGNSDVYGPQYLLDKNVILVTINYRLGPLGFLSTGDEDCPGNNGLKDQVAALRWVRNNIAAFGGNPNSVTIFGESAGGASVHYHILSPLSKGLFHRGISQSGNALNPWAHAPNGTTKYQANKLGILLGCPTQCSKVLLECLKMKQATDIIGTEKQFVEWNIDPMIPFKPVVETQVGKGDEAFLTKEPLEILLTEKCELVPWMVGFLSSDGAIMTSTVFGKNIVNELDEKFDRLIPMMMYFRETAPKSACEVAKKIREFYFADQKIDENSAKLITDMYTDAFFLSGSDPSVKLHVKRASDVFYYYLDYRGTNSWSTKFGDSTRDYGVCHLDDLLYLFPQDHFFPQSNRTPEDDQMIDTLTTLWTNFAHSGNPTPEPGILGQWLPVCSADDPQYAHINYNGLKMNQTLLKKRAEFWASLPHKGRMPSINKDEL